MIQLVGLTNLIRFLKHLVPTFLQPSMALHVHSHLSKLCAWPVFHVSGAVGLNISVVGYLITIVFRVLDDCMNTP